jgi:hypothetical protein
MAGSFLVSCGKPTTTNFVLSGFISKELFAHQLLIFVRSSFTAEIALNESDTENLKYN